MAWVPEINQVERFGAACLSPCHLLHLGRRFLAEMRLTDLDQCRTGLGGGPQMVQAGQVLASQFASIQKHSIQR